MPPWAVLGLAAVLGGCGTTDPEPTLGSWGADQVRAIRGSDTSKPAIVVSELDSQRYQTLVNEPRPVIRSETARAALSASLEHDVADAKQTLADVSTADDVMQPIRGPEAGRASTLDSLVGDPPPPPIVPGKPTPVPPPAPPEAIHVQVAMPSNSKSTPDDSAVKTIYRERLAESVTAAPPPRPMGHTDAAPDVDTSVVAPPSLTPPAEYRRRQAALGFQSLAALDPVESRSTIEAGRVKFGEGTFEMVAGQSAVLNDVVRLYHEKGGRIRIIGHSVSGRLDVNAKANREANASLARGRAEAVARELIRLGIPGRSIYAGATAADLAVNGPVDLADEEANIFIDY